MICFVTIIYSIEAQSLNKILVEPVDLDGIIVDRRCGSPSLGVLVVSSEIPGLIFELNMPDRLRNVVFDGARNEYVLCVEPTDRLYWITIRGQGYEEINFEVRNVRTGHPQIFRALSIEEEKPCWEEHWRTGNAHFANSQYVEARTYYNLATECHDLPTVNELSQKITDATRAINSRRDADNDFSRGSYDMAKRGYETLISLNPNDHFARERLAECNRRIEYAEAEARRTARRNNFRNFLDNASSSSSSSSGTTTRSSSSGSSSTYTPPRRNVSTGTGTR